VTARNGEHTWGRVSAVAGDSSTDNERVVAVDFGHGPLRDQHDDDTT